MFLRILLATVISLSPIPHLFAADTRVESPAAEQKDVHEITGETLGALDLALSRLTLTVEHLANLVRNGKMATHNRAEALTWLGAMSNRIATVRSFPFTTNHAVFFARFELVSELAHALHEATHSRCTRLGAFDEQAWGNMCAIASQDRGTTRVAISEEMITAIRKNCEAEVLQLEQEVDKSGLLPHQRLYTASSRLWHQYKIGKKLKISLAVGTVGAISIYGVAKLLDIQSNSNSRFAPVVFQGDRVFQSIFGEQSIYNPSHNAFNGAHPLGKYLFSIGGGLAFMDLVGKADGAVRGLSRNFGISQWYRRAKIRAHAFLTGSEAGLRATADDRYLCTVTLDDSEFDKVEGAGRLREVIEFLKNADRNIRAGLKVPKIFLLTGPSGSGKSYLAEAFYNSLKKITATNNIAGRGVGLKFYRVNATSWMDWGTDPVTAMRALSSFGSPTVIFLDELHLFGLQSAQDRQVLSQFLLYFDEVSRNDDPDHITIIIAATNRPENLDPALLRSGRLGERIHIDFPSCDAREHMLHILCKQHAVSTERMNVSLIAKLTDRCTFSDLREIFNAAQANAHRKNHGVTYEDLYEALKKTVRKIQSDESLTAEERSAVAAYQAGAAITQLLIKPHGVHLEAVTTLAYPKKIQERYDWMVAVEEPEKTAKQLAEIHKLEYGLTYVWSDSERIDFESPEIQSATIDILLAGRVAQKILLGVETGYRNTDKKHAYKKALSLVLNGLELESFSEKQRNDMREKATVYIEEREAAVEKLLRAHEQQLRTLHAELLEKRYVTAEDLEKIAA